MVPPNVRRSWKCLVLVDSWGQFFDRGLVMMWQDFESLHDSLLRHLEFLGHLAKGLSDMGSLVNDEVGCCLCLGVCVVVVDGGKLNKPTLDLFFSFLHTLNEVFFHKGGINIGIVHVSKFLGYGLPC